MAEDETPAAQPRPVWEYVAVPRSTEDDLAYPTSALTRDLNGMGADGWELVTIDAGVMVFKRPKAKAADGPVVRPW